MPELPEVETVRRGLSHAMVGAQIAAVDQRRPDLRFPLPEKFAERLSGRRIEALSRRAKYLLADLDDDVLLVMHLGMSGSFRVIEHANNATAGNFHYARGKNEAHDHVEFVLSNGRRVIYNDPRRFGFMDLIPRSEFAEHKLFRNLGLEPLGNEFGVAALCARMADRNASLKSALLDQTLIAGLGNIYVCEALHRARLSPLRSAGVLVRRNGEPTAGAERLAAAIRDVLNEAIEAGGSSLRDHAATDGSLGYFQHSFRVYGREGDACPTSGCGGTIRRVVQSGRSTFHCANCQK